MDVPAYVVALGFIALIVGLSWLYGRVEVDRVSEAMKLVRKGSPIIDVDPPDEFERDHPEGAINVPLEDFDELVDDLDTSRPVVVYGHNPVSSHIAALKLKRLGFKVVDLGPAKEDGWLSGELPPEEKT